MTTAKPKTNEFDVPNDQDVTPDTYQGGEPDAPENDTQNYIVHRRTWTDDKGIQQTEENRMTMDEWPAYAKENNL
jgi:hypothetical protein